MCRNRRVLNVLSGMAARASGPKTTGSKVSQEATGKWHAPNSRLQRTSARSPATLPCTVFVAGRSPLNRKTVRRLVLDRTRPTILEELSALTRCPQRKVFVPFTARFPTARKHRERTFLAASAGISRRRRRPPPRVSQPSFTISRQASLQRCAVPP